MARENYWTRPVGRRRVLAGGATAAVGVSALALTGCGDDEDNKGEATGKTPQGVQPGTASAATATPGKAINRDGTLKARQTSIFASINPYKGLDSGLYWGFLVYDHLWYTPLDTGIRENFLATSIEQADPLSFTVKIGQSFFHNKPPINGREVKSSDIKASWEAAVASKTVSKSTWWNFTLDKIETPDDKTMKVTLKQPDAWTFTSTNAGSPLTASILPEEHAKDVSLMDKDLIGSSRYEFVSHENGTNFKLKRNDNFRIKGEPNLAGIQYKLIQEQAAALAAFSAKEIDGVLPANKLEREQLEQKHGKEIAIETELNRAIWIVQGRGDGQWKDPRVAKAISFALDKDEMIKLMNFGEGAKSGVVPPTFTSYAKTEKEIADTYGKFDVTQAKALLTASGFDVSKEYTMKYPVLGERYAQFTQIVQSQLTKNLGLKIKVVPEDFGKWLGQSLYGGDYDGFMLYPTLAYDDPSSYIGSYTKLIGGRPNWAGFVSDELDGLVNKQKTILDDKQRETAIKEIQTKAYDLGAPYIPTFVAIGSTATWGYVQGRIINRGSYGAFAQKTWIDKS
jgi:ABC-type transport system substrate-binding protein